MTGAVEWSTLLWVVGLVVGVAGGSLAIGWQVLGWVSAQFATRDQAIDEAKRTMDLRVEAVDLRAKLEEGRLAKDLSDHKLHAAEVFATKSGLTEALNRVHDALDKLTGRIDALLTQNRDGLPKS